MMSDLFLNWFKMKEENKDVLFIDPYVRQNNDTTTKDIHILNPGSYVCTCNLYGKRDFTDVIKSHGMGRLPWLINHMSS